MSVKFDISSLVYKGYKLAGKSMGLDPRSEMDQQSFNVLQSALDGKLEIVEPTTAATKVGNIPAIKLDQILSDKAKDLFGFRMHSTCEERYVKVHSKKTGKFKYKRKAYFAQYMGVKVTLNDGGEVDKSNLKDFCDLINKLADAGKIGVDPKFPEIHIGALQDGLITMPLLGPTHKENTAMLLLFVGSAFSKNQLNKFMGMPLFVNETEMPKVDWTKK